MKKIGSHTAPHRGRDHRQACELPFGDHRARGAWFLAGDDRGESADSRVRGPVPTEAITGIVKYRYWPLKRAGRL
jgi:signal peptidase I